MDRGETVMAFLVALGAAALAMVLIAGHQAPGEGWPAPLFIGFLTALLVDQARATRALRGRAATPAECRRP